MNRTVLVIALAIGALAGCASDTVPASVPQVTVAPPRAAAELQVPVVTDTDVSSMEVAVAALEESVQEVTPAGPEPTRFTLRRGETLAHFARWSGHPVEEIADTSALPLDGIYAVGTELAIGLTLEERTRVEQRRDAHHRTRAESYLASRGAAGTDFYRVRTGDNAWSVAQDHHGMPVWLLESLNPSVDLDRLRPGQELLVPVFSDIVVEASPEDPS